MITVNIPTVLDIEVKNDKIIIKDVKTLRTIWGSTSAEYDFRNVKKKDGVYEIDKSIIKKRVEKLRKDRDIISKRIDLIESLYIELGIKSGGK